MAATGNTATPRIDMQDAAQRARWTREFNVTDDQLEQAVSKVGEVAADVELYLKGSRSSTNSDATGDTGS
ncbi:hypothetical protein RT97_29140 [Variovorax paradoxus]|uniref:DUF3606 domain-containing protein n=1 Tax=Variovorax paradoxus TaxID=34073 RepID=A0A0D0JXW5_VARPD|nr:DUF3606 domain-containing protein [Variovorax paradoxus]KIQ18507.1 hypothetical protein RT97_29140 [Variovorax paradoxus]